MIYLFTIMKKRNSLLHLWHKCLIYCFASSVCEQVCCGTLLCPEVCLEIFVQMHRKWRSNKNTSSASLKFIEIDWSHNNICLTSLKFYQSSGIAHTYFLYVRAIWDFWTCKWNSDLESVSISTSYHHTTTVKMIWCRVRIKSSQPCASTVILHAITVAVLGRFIMD